jgi:enoyl-CoA hydratase/carnithine racemase
MTGAAGGRRDPSGKASAVAVEFDAGVATIRIERPDVRNALDRPAWRALAAHLDEVAARPAEARVVLLVSAGTEAFVAGADIRELRDVTGSPSEIRPYVELIESVMKRLEALPQPVVAVAGGDAIGAGLELMAACDLRLMQRGARLGIPAAKLGLAITGQDLHRLGRLVGLGRVKWLLLTGRLIDASIALEWGLVDGVHGADELEAAARELAHAVAANSALTHRLTKRALLNYTDPGRQGDDAGFACSLAAWSSPSLAEGIAAFLARRPPDFPAVECSETDRNH